MFAYIIVCLLYFVGVGLIVTSAFLVAQPVGLFVLGIATLVTCFLVSYAAIEKDY